MPTIRRSKADGFEEIGQDVAADLLRHGDSSLWLHFDSPKKEEVHFLQEHLKIHDLTLDDVIHQNQRPKLDTFDDYVYLAVHPLRKEGEQVEPSELDAPGEILDRVRSLRPLTRA
jgi:magnesium transporter